MTSNLDLNPLHEFVNLFGLVQMPIISAIGHARDDVLLNHVADFNVATPTSAIQKIVSNKNKFEIKLQELANNLSNSIHRLLIRKTNEIENALALPHTLLKKIEMHTRSLKKLESKASKVFQGVLFARKQKLLQMEAVIEKLQKSMINAEKSKNLLPTT